MSDLARIEENYKRKSIEDLVELTLNPQELRLEVIPVLQQELLNRGQHKEALSLTEFLVNSKGKHSLKNSSNEEVYRLVNERLDAGESIESIQMHLKDEGVDMLERISVEGGGKKDALEHLRHLKQQGLANQEIYTRLKLSLSLEKEEVDLLNSQLKNSGTRNQVFGYTMIVIAFLLIFVSLSLGGNVTIGAIGILCVGVWRVYEGSEQLKEANAENFKTTE